MLPWVIGFDECGDALLEIGLWHIGIFVLEEGEKKREEERRGERRGEKRGERVREDVQQHTVQHTVQYSAVSASKQPIYL